MAATRSLEQDFPSRKPSASLSAHSPVLNNDEAYYHSNCNCNCLKYDDDEDSYVVEPSPAADVSWSLSPPATPPQSPAHGN